MVPVINTCKQCSAEFEITPEDLKFYDKISPVFNGRNYLIPPPTLCPDCRQQRRLTFRNERKLYHRKCDLTGKEIISTYSPDKPCKVYDQQVWWSDQWEPLKYGRSFDFTRSFFEQYKELSLVTPRPCIVNMSSENSLYTNHSSYNKNCYMCINTGYSEDLLYCSNFTLDSKDCTDCLAIQNCEQCYMCVNTRKSSFSSYLYECMQCNDSAFLYDCVSCNDCFGCWNLRHKQYVIFNVQYTKEQYEKKLAEILPKTGADYEKMFQTFWDIIGKKALHKSLFKENSEECSGDHLSNDKLVTHAYYTFDSQDCAYSYDAGELKSCQDVTEPYKGELEYETHACNIGYQLIGCSKCYESNNIFYSQYCWYSSNLFGCFGLKRKQYCIFNKQFLKEEYEKLVPEIIEHMQRTGEWGEFFPMRITPFGYNETVANEYYPLTKDKAVKLGVMWKEENISNHYEGVKIDLPENIEEVPDEITKQILTCKGCLKNYRIIFAELKFYRNRKLPLPQLCPDCRHQRRFSLRNPRKIWNRLCAKCKATIQTTYAPARPEIIYCEPCYLKEVY